MYANDCFCYWIKRMTFLFIVVFTMTNPARAGVINFDDIPYVPLDPEWPQFYDVEVTDQYLDQGVLIDGGYLGRRYPEEEHVDNPQYLFGGNFMRMTFVGERLPNYVTMTVSSVFDYANIINFYGPDGHLFEMTTSGSRGSLLPGKPYRHNQPVSFKSHTGISEITFEGFYNMRWGTLVDNLRFKSSRQTSVPETNALWLLFIGIAAIAIHRHKQMS